MSDRIYPQWGSAPDKVLEKFEEAVLELSSNVVAIGALVLLGLLLLTQPATMDSQSAGEA